MNLHRFETIDPQLLPGLINTALRNDCEDLDDLLRTHDIDEESLVQRMSELGYRYHAATHQFQSVSAMDPP